jgi:hypothetical protein
MEITRKKGEILIQYREDGLKKTWNKLKEDKWKDHMVSEIKQRHVQRQPEGFKR